MLDISSASWNTKNVVSINFTHLRFAKEWQWLFVQKYSIFGAWHYLWQCKRLKICTFVIAQLRYQQTTANNSNDNINCWMTKIFNVCLREQSKPTACSYSAFRLNCLASILRVIYKCTEYSIFIVGCIAKLQSIHAIWIL